MLAKISELKVIQFYSPLTAVRVNLATVPFRGAAISELTPLASNIIPGGSDTTRSGSTNKLPIGL